MRVMSWNVNKSANSAGRIDEQFDVIDEIGPDVLLLQEVRHGTNQEWVESWREGLSQRGLGTIEHSCDWAAELADSTVPPHDDIGHDNGHITAVRDGWDLTLRQQRINDRLDSANQGRFETNFPEKILVTELETGEETIEIWNVRAVPASGWGDEKVKIFETVYERIVEAGERVRLIAGDLNSPAKELPDGQAVPFGYDKAPTFGLRQVNAELNLLKGLGHLGILDVFRTIHGYGELDVRDTSWRDKRFDHIFASEALAPVACGYKEEGLACSDHAPIVADFEREE